VAPRADLSQTLKATFGYTAFRPLQREICDATLAGRDVFALLPTGGGKSLCFQLPALVRPGLTVVVSPLIALMKDQVDQLTAAGVAATYLNSTLGAAEAAAQAAARQGRRLRPAITRNHALKPGPATPLWNELVKRALPHLSKRGSKARLARILGVPRQRLHDCLKARRACLNADRTLLLLCWIEARQRDRHLRA
jgi:hypothetical protein